MPYETANILAELGFAFKKSRLLLPLGQTSLRSLEELQQRIEDTWLLTNGDNPKWSTHSWLNIAYSRDIILGSPGCKPDDRFCQPLSTSSVPK